LQIKFISTMKVEIISIGDELLIGQVVNTNAAWMGEQLTDAGIEVIRITAVSDRAEDIKDAMHLASQHADAVLITGGLGPTNDDITKTVLCEYFDTVLENHVPTYLHIEAMFAKRGYKFTERNRQQSMLPKGCTILPNSVGTAPGMLFERGDTIFISMPGVPMEMKAIMSEEAIPFLKRKNNGSAIFRHTVITHGVGESWLAERIAGWEESLPENVKLAYLPRPGMVRLRITATGNDVQMLKDQVMGFTAELHKIIPELIIGYNEDTMESVVMQLLLEQNKTLSVAESCTGGYIAQLMTAMAGVSAVFKGGVVAYENSVKQNLLGVSAKALEAHGAVSREVVIEMARGIMESTGSDMAVATSGIAGPSGGTKEKPVGTVWIAIANGDAVRAEKFFFGGNRERVIKQSALKALNMVREELIISK